MRDFITLTTVGNIKIVVNVVNVCAIYEHQKIPEVTIVTLADGSQYNVHESVVEVISRCRGI